MPRPVKPRRVGYLPPAMFFHPSGLPAPGAREVTIGIDEWETLRLKDYLGMDQQVCADCMHLAQSTFQRILASARSKVSRALVEGLPIRIEAGNRQIIGQWLCQDCGHSWEETISPEVVRQRRCPACGFSQDEHRGHGHGWGPPPWSGPGRRSGR